MLELARADWRRVIDTNFTSAFYFSREAAQRMVPRGYGTIISIGSFTSELAQASVISVTIAEGSIRMLTRKMAAEWAAHGIHAIAIGSGHTLTDMNESLLNDPRWDALLSGRMPAGQCGAPKTLVGVAVFPALRASDYVNGQMIQVKGGRSSVL